MTDVAVNYANQPSAYAFQPMDETMGKRIARLRESKGWSQAELARKLGITRASVHQWENDSSPNIRPANLLALADLLGTDPYYLVHGPDRGGAPGSDAANSGRYRTIRRRG
jgi:transcriptional regulator with XRE-family HTH domain